MSKIPAINEIDANSPSQESTEVVVNNTRITPDIDEVDGNVPGQSSTEVIVNATTVTPDINEIKETISGAATIQEIDGTRKPTISEIYKIVNDGLFESTTNWWDYAYKLSQAQLNQDIISRLDNGVIGGGYSKGADIITTTSNKIPSNTNVYSALKSDELYPKKLSDELINGIYDFLNGITIGKPTAYTGGTWSVDKTGRTHLTTDYLYVRLKAIFETLQILNVDTIGGKLVISPAGSIRVAYVDRIKIDAPVFEHDEKTDVWSIPQVEDAEGNLVNETLNQEVYRCYFLGEQDGEEIDNKWKVGDQAQAKTFNVKKGTYHKVENSYLWRLVVGVSSDTVDIDGKKYHYVDLSQIDFDSGSDAPAPGDVLNQIGHRLNDTQRQTALVLNAIDNFAPSITLYAGVNYYTFLNKEYVEFGVYQGKAFFNVYGDMYIGDKGADPKTYIKYKNGKINIKANLEIGSSIGGKDLNKYIKENGGLDKEAVEKLINNAQVIKDLQNQADGAIETWFYEGVPTPNNYPSTDKENKGDVLTYNIPGIDWYNEDINNYNAIKDSDKYTEAEKAAIKIKVRERHIGDLYYDQKTGYAYRFTRYDDDIKPYRWNVISDSELTKILEAANRAQATADGKMKVYYGETKPTNYQAGDIWVNATLEGKFNNDIARAVAKNESFNADDWVLASRYSEAIADIQKWTNEYETKFDILADDVKKQKDQSIIVWYLEYEPTIDNAPANKWNTETLRSEHIGDIVYDIKNNHSYRWTGSAWVQIKDADFNEAMKAAKAADDKAGAAGDLADSKRRIFYSDTTPTKPFDKGDLWIKQVKGKTETWVYNGTAWVKSEDKDLADFSAAINEELTGIKGQLDGKAETWYQNTNPRNKETGKWESGGTDKTHEGDIWYDTTNGTTKYWTGSAWEKMDIPKDVFDTIDGKSSIFVDSYDEAKAGTGAINKGYKERDLWILPANATVNGTAYYKGDMLTATSNNKKFDETNWEKKVRYVGPTELNKAIDTVNNKINTITNTTIPGINNRFNEFVKDGVLDSSEKARLTDLLNQASNEVAAVVDQVTNITKSKYLAEDNANRGELIKANAAMNTAWKSYNTLIKKLVDANTKITKVNIGEANNYYNTLQTKIKEVKQYLAICQADILNSMGTDITSYKYLKDILNQNTEVTGGLILTNAILFKDVDKKVTAGMNGIVKGDKSSIAAWYGGPMVDRDTFTKEQLETKVAGTDYAMSLLRHDGTGYLAGGNIHWDAKGVLSGNFNSFILQTVNIAAMFFYIRLFYLHSPIQDTTKFENIDYVTPMKPFSRLSVQSLGGTEGGNSLPTGLFIGDSKTGGSFQVGNVIIRTNSKDPNILEIVSATNGKTAHLGVQGGVSAYGTYTSSTGGGGGLSGTIIPYSTAIASDPQNEGTKIASASSIYKLHKRISDIESNGATSITVTGTGNAITSVSKNGTSITFTKGSTFLTSHQSLAAYLTKSEASSTYQPKGNYLTSHQSLADYAKKSEIPTKVSQLSNDKGYLTSHQSLANYVTINDSRLSDSRYPKFANNTWYLVGDDAYIGDHNIGGTFCIKSNNSETVTGIALYSKDETKAAKIWFDNTNINLDKQLVMNNNRIWVQGSGTAGGNNNRLTLVAGMPSGLVYNTSCRGTILYSNGIAFADPYNGNSNNDSGWIRHLETNPNAGTLEIAVGDDASNEQIHFRWYNTNASAETIVHDITVPKATGTLALTSQIPTSLKSPNSLSWSGYNTGSYDGSSAKSFVIPSNNNQLANGAGYDTVTSVNNKLNNLLIGSIGENIGYVNNDTHIVQLGYFNVNSFNYSSANLIVTIAFWGNQHNSTDIISINADRNTNKDYYAQFTITRVNLTDNTNQRIFYYKRDGAFVRLYMEVHGGNSYGRINIKLLSSSYINFWITELKYNVSNSNFTKITYGGRIQHSYTTDTCLGNATSATKLQTARTIWGQGFDGTGNVNGTIYINNSDSKNGAIILNNNVNANARISAIGNQVIFNTGAAIRFGETAWDWNKWAGLKYTHSNKTIYLGIAENSAFNANSAQSDGILRLAGIKTITPDSGARIGNTGGDLFLGNSSNSGWVKVQDMTSQANINNWRIYQNGDAMFNNLTVRNSSTFDGIKNTFNSDVYLNSYVFNRGILPASREVNNKGLNYYVWGDALCSGITAITDSIYVNQVTIQYSNNNGSSWTKYELSENNKFKLYANVADNYNIMLGHNLISGNTDAEKLAQIKKNELIVSFYISNSSYSQPYFASVDISNGVNVICTVDILDKDGTVVESYTKTMFGWNEINYINICANPNTPYGVGNDTRRYIRFRFKHEQSTTALRNALINRIRIFSFTKYSYPTDRFMGHTGHIYNFDYNMNTYFPNSILAKGGITAYQSSDVRLKTNITKLNCLNVIKSIGGTYEFDYLRDHKHSIGFIAQRVSNPLLKDIIAKDKDGYLKINYWSPKLISLAFGALTEIDNEVDKLKARVRELETEVEYLKNKDYAIQ